jgi:hypothetical protein
MNALPNVLKATWPTPGLLDKDWQAVTEETAAKHRNKPGAQLHTAHLMPRAVWPTPNVPNGGRQPKGGISCLVQDLKAVWATPKGTVAGPDMALPAQASGTASSGCLARTASFVERLTTLSAWLMGYTRQYLAHWETRSSRKSRRKSSAP